VTLGLVVCAIGVAGVLASIARDWKPGNALFKPLASAGLLLAAVRAPAFELPSPEGGALLLAGLAFAALGDVALIGRGRLALGAGLGAFALAQLAYTGYFLTHGARWWTFLPVALVVFGMAHAVWRWLEPHVEPKLRAPVRVYSALVTLMASAAIASLPAIVVAAPSPGEAPAFMLPAFGGGMLFVSDVAVARERFVDPGGGSRLWGLPLYYTAQLLIATAVV